MAEWSSEGWVVIVKESGGHAFAVRETREEDADEVVLEAESSGFKAAKLPLLRCNVEVCEPFAHSRFAVAFPW